MDDPPSIKAVALTLIKRPSRGYFLPLRGIDQDGGSSTGCLLLPLS